MALPSSMTVAGAGVAALNGYYPLASGTDGNGNQYYAQSGGGFTLWWFSGGNGFWIIGSTLDSTAAGYYYNENTYAKGPLGFWYRIDEAGGEYGFGANGVDPLPTVTAGVYPPINLTASIIY